MRHALKSLMRLFLRYEGSLAPRRVVVTPNISANTILMTDMFHNRNVRVNIGRNQQAASSGASMTPVSAVVELAANLAQKIKSLHWA